MKQSKSVDEYILSAPKATQQKLKDLRKIIREAATKAEEKISYGIPYYGYKGRLVYFAYSKNHIGIYFPPPTVESHKKELTGYKTSKSGVQLPNKDRLPTSLIKKLIKDQIKTNDKNEK